MSETPLPKFTGSAVAALAAIRSKDISVRELTEIFLSRAEDGNAKTSALKEILYKDALLTADRLDAQLRENQDIGPLGGLPVVVKENCDISGAICSAGLSFRAEHRPIRDAEIVARLRSAGAIIVGVSASDPGAFSTRTPEVSHPYDSDLTVGGSSGGSGAALGAGMCLGAIGTDTGGSIRIPAACCGVVGLKPTYNSLPMAGVFPLVPSLDHVGPMARDIEDTELLWRGLTNDPQAAPIDNPTVGYDPDWLKEADAPVRDAFASFFETLDTQGISYKPINLPNLDEISHVHGVIFLNEAFELHMGEYREFRDDYPLIAQEWFDLAESADPETVNIAKSRRSAYTSWVSAIFSEIDIIAIPTQLAFGIRKFDTTVNVAGQTLETTMAMVRTTCLFNHTGHPAIALPIGPGTNGVQASVQLVANKSREAGLLSFAKSLSQEH